MLLPRSAVLSFIAGWLGVGALLGGQTVAGPHVEVIRYWSFGDVTRIAIETAGDYHFTTDSIDNPSRVFFDLNGLKPPSTVHHGMQTIAVGDKLVKQIRVAEVIPGTTRIVLDVLAPVDVVSSQLVNPDRLMIEIRPKDNAPLITRDIRHSLTGAQRVNLSVPTLDTDKDLPPPVIRPVAASIEKPVVRPLETTPSALPVVPTTTLPAPPRMTAAVPATSEGSSDPSLVRVLGLKLGRVVIDAGHGGKDTGTIGPNGLLEKDLVLDVALRLGKLIHQQLGADSCLYPLGRHIHSAGGTHSDGESSESRFFHFDSCQRIFRSIGHRR